MTWQSINSERLAKKNVFSNTSLIIGYSVVVAFLSAVTFVIYAIDKRRAQTDRRRCFGEDIALVSALRWLARCNRRSTICSAQNEKGSFSIPFSS